MHGIEHWLRVLINGRLIAAQSGADIEVVEHFALLHDVQRQDEYRDIQHGNRAADFAASLLGDWIHLNSTQMYQLTEACRYHSMGRLSKDVTIQSCWDADRLDLGRVGEKPNPTYLGNKAARDNGFIKEALHRSKIASLIISLRGESNVCSRTEPTANTSERKITLLSLGDTDFPAGRNFHGVGLGCFFHHLFG